MYKAKTPVLLLIYKRPELTKKVIESLRVVKPSKIFIAADGPKTNTDVDLINETRQVMKEIDWKCKVKTNYSNKNMGLRKRVSSAVSWAFKHTETLIVLEDDCIASSSFFRFCDELLEKYKDDEQIMAISGNNFQRGIKRGNASYYFSIYPHCWGWATWKRAWKLYDDKMKDWPKIKDKLLSQKVSYLPSRIYWKYTLDKTYNEEINSWAYRWQYSCWVNNGLTILPNTNLVTNIGFGRSATNTKNKIRGLSKKEINFPLKHPARMSVNKIADKFTETHHFITPRIIAGIIYRRIF